MPRVSPSSQCVVAQNGLGRAATSDEREIVDIKAEHIDAHPPAALQRFSDPALYHGLADLAY